MSNLLLKTLRESGIIMDGVIPFVQQSCAPRLLSTYPGKVVMAMPEGTRTGRFWLVSEEDGKRMAQAGYKLLSVE